MTLPRPRTPLDSLENKGCGKTELVETLSRRGWDVLDEAFLDMPRSLTLHPQSLTLEMRWVTDWCVTGLRVSPHSNPNPPLAATKLNSRRSRFARVLREFDSSGSSRKVLFTDRSPFSAALYCQGTKGADFILPVVRAQMAELSQQAKIDFYSVRVSVDRDVLWRRVQDRLVREPDRAALQEDSKEWFDHVLGFYDRLEWDLVVDNTAEWNVDDVCDRALRGVACASPHFRELLAEKENRGERTHASKDVVRVVADEALREANAARPTRV